MPPTATSSASATATTPLGTEPQQPRAGRPAIDWEQGFLFYASLSPAERAYRAVADHFAVSPRTVERHGRDKGWKARIRALEAEAAALADTRLSEERARTLADLNLLLGASLHSYATELRAGKVKFSPSDLLRLFKLSQELWSTDDQARREKSPVPEAESLDQAAEEARTLEVIQALQEAGPFDRLQSHFVNSDKSLDARTQTEAG